MAYKLDYTHRPRRPASPQEKTAYVLVLVLLAWWLIPIQVIGFSYTEWIDNSVDEGGSTVTAIQGNHLTLSNGQKFLITNIGPGPVRLPLAVGVKVKLVAESQSDQSPAKYFQLEIMRPIEYHFETPERRQMITIPLHPQKFKIYKAEPFADVREIPTSDQPPAP